MVRKGETAISNAPLRPEPPQPFKAGDDSPQMRDLPVLRQIYDELGAVVSLADQVRRINERLDTSGAEVADALPCPIGARGAPAAPEPAGAPAPQAPETAPPPPEPEKPPEVDEEAVNALYQRAYSFVGGVINSAKQGTTLSVDVALAILTRIIGMKGATDLLYKQAIYAQEAKQDAGFSAALVTHSVNVGVYALRIGEGMNFEDHRLVDLGLAALLHDIGMTRLPESILTKGKWTNEEKAEMQRHPQYGYEILSKLGKDYQWLADVAYQEQEREDGSGYPRGLKGDQIEEYARIIAVADCFAGLTRSRPDRRGMLPFDAVRFMLQNQRGTFSQQVLKVLLQKLSAFPLKSYVKLNSGAVGRVVETYESHPLRPSVEILYDSQEKKVRNIQTINLRETRILHITDVISEDDLPDKK